MSIRCTAKAVIIQNGCILLNKCTRQNGETYYNLPGGGQKKYESMEAAVCREVMEETGYTVENLRFAALAEDIFTSPELRKSGSGYCHRIYHYFTANLADVERNGVSEKDWQMEESIWVELSKVKTLGEIYPNRLAELIDNIQAGGPPMYLGTTLIDE